jgi:hypothetical protein
MTCWHTKFWHSDPTGKTFWQLYIFSELDHADPYPWLLWLFVEQTCMRTWRPPKSPFSNEKTSVQVKKDLCACHAPFVQKNGRKSSWCMHSCYCRQWQNYCNACSNSLCASPGFLRSLNPVAENTKCCATKNLMTESWWLLCLQVCISVLSFCSPMLPKSLLQRWIFSIWGLGCKSSRSYLTLCSHHIFKF